MPVLEDDGRGLGAFGLPWQLVHPPRLHAVDHVMAMGVEVGRSVLLAGSDSVARRADRGQTARSDLSGAARRS